MQSGLLCSDALTREGQVSRWVTISFGKAAVLTATVIHGLFFQIQSILCIDWQITEIKAVIAQKLLPLLVKMSVYDINEYMFAHLFSKYL